MTIIHSKEDIKRVETGPLKINDDWTGIFIRGDNSLYYSFIIDQIIEKCNKSLDPIEIVELKNLSELLKRCRDN